MAKLSYYTILTSMYLLRQNGRRMRKRGKIHICVFGKSKVYYNTEKLEYLLIYHQAEDIFGNYIYNSDLEGHFTRDIWTILDCS